MEKSHILDLWHIMCKRSLDKFLGSCQELSEVNVAQDGTICAISLV